MNSLIPAKTKRVLQVILIAFLAIVFRIWHLGVIQRDARIVEAKMPQQRTILLRADRGTICDRFHIPLALNRICYNAAIYYGQIAQIPVVNWKADETGNRVRHYARKEYIRELSGILAKALDLEEERVEDLIHAKASLFPHVPFVIKAGISEEEHYRLKMLEKDWLGVHAEIAAERYYPLGKVASEIIGTMGAISPREYGEIAQEIGLLQRSIELYEQGIDITLPDGYETFDQLYRRYNELKEKAYTLSDLVGKTGIEGQFEEELRGFFGKKTFEIDQKGRYLREILGGKPAVAGQQLILTISSELQQFAESLLAQNEKTREGRSIGLDPADKKRKVQKQPWIKGGAIVALDPNNGEVLALAGYPRFDPNDFIPSANAEKKEAKHRQICRWLENERFIAAVWDGKEELSRERFGGSPRQFLDEKHPLTWEFYLDLILPTETPIKTLFTRCDDLKSAIQIQEDFEALLYFSKGEDSLDEIFSRTAELPLDAAAPLKRLGSALSSIPSNKDKLFAIDLCRMAVYSPAFTDPLIAQVGTLKISAYRALCQAFQRIETEAKKHYQEKFHSEEFRQWRELHQKEFLAEKRREEKEKKTFSRPYIDYLDQKEKELFTADWEEKRLPLLLELILEQKEEIKLHDICKTLSKPLAEEFLRSFRSFSQMDRPLLSSNQKMEKDLARSFYPTGGFGFSRSFAFQSGSPQGSLFKLITAYEGLRQGQVPILIDDLTRDPQVVAYSSTGTPFPRFYKGGRLPRSHLAQIGKIDLLGAIEQSSNSYFSILAGDYLEHPEDLARAAQLFGFGKKTGIDLPGEFRGNVPTDLKSNRTGLYSTAIGQHTLLNTPLQTALMLATIANGGRLLKPKIAKVVKGFSPDRHPLGAFAAASYFAKEELETIGIHFPLFTGIHHRNSLEETTESPTEIRSSIPLSPQIRSTLLEGMDRAIWSQKGSARPSAIKQLLANPLLMRNYLSLEHQMIGKTSTAEIVHNPAANPSSRPQIYKNIWFGAISFSPTKIRWDHPDLIVVVFLRYGDGGKEAAPLAAQMIQKWRDLQQTHNP
ncbi:MAG TPA: penicillin-binding transpeptidase domain-containing protein [Chlamydiales bacterium]|nr:penicillin-binding transpeptidase domain-containing protein [Chlamydiales bacterium]